MSDIFNRGPKRNNTFFLSRGFFTFFFGLVLTIIISWFVLIGYLGYRVVSEGPEGIGQMIGRGIGSIEKGYKDSK